MNTAFLTRDDFTEALKEILMPLEKHFSDSCARMRLGSSDARRPTASLSAAFFQRLFLRTARLMTGE